MLLFCRLYPGKEHTATKLPRMSEKFLMFQKVPFIRFCAGFKKKDIWKLTTKNSTAETDGIIKSPKKEGNFTFHLKQVGLNTARKSIQFFWNKRRIFTTPKNSRKFPAKLPVYKISIFLEESNDKRRVP